MLSIALVLLATIEYVKAGYSMGNCPDVSTYTTMGITYPFSAKTLKPLYIDKSVDRTLTSISKAMERSGTTFPIDLDYIACLEFSLQGNSDETLEAVYNGYATGITFPTSDSGDVIYVGVNDYYFPVTAAYMDDEGYSIYVCFDAANLNITDSSGNSVIPDSY
jgi:hypothetical protein